MAQDRNSKSSTNSTFITPITVAQFLRKSKKRILDIWEDRARKAVLAATTVDATVLRNSLPEFLDALAAQLAQDTLLGTQTAEEVAEELKVIREHGHERAQVESYDMVQVVEEYEILRRVIFEVLREQGQMTADCQDIVLDALASGVKNAVAEFGNAKQDALKRTGKKLRASEQRLRLVVEGVKDHAIICFDSEGEITGWNEGAEKIFGYKRKEIRGQKAEILFSSEDRKSGVHKLEMQQAAETGSAEDNRWHVKKDGTLFFACGIMNPLYDSDSRVIGFVKVLRDATKHKQDEEALKVSELRYKLVTRATRNIVWDWELETDQIHWNEAMTTELGYDLPNHVSSVQWWKDHLHPEDRERVQRSIQDIINSSDKEFWSDEYRFRTANGSYRLFRNRGSILRSPSGHGNRMIGAMEDVTEESAQRFSQLADAMPQIVWTSEPDGHLDYYNRGFFEYTGLTFEDLKGWGWNKIIYPDDFDRTITAWTESLQSEKDYYMEYRLKRSDGSYRWHLARAVPIRNESGKVIKWYGASTDIHDVVQLKEQLEMARLQAEAANATKSSFLANMSHELRTPMTAVLGFAELLRDVSLTELEKQEAIIRIERSGRSLLRVLDDILDISKIEAGKLTIQKSRFSPAAVASEVVALMRLSAEQKGVGVRLKIDSSVPTMACSDPARIRQILVNLVGNAVKFTPQGEICLTVKVQAPNCITYEVADTGIGIAKTDQSKLFQPFVQADESITRKFGGTGLGLLLSRRIAEQLGGTLELVESQAQKGSKFAVTIEASPFEYLEERLSSHAIKSSTSLSSKRDLEGVKVLLAEDVPDNQVLMDRYLQSAGAIVEIANNGEEALQKVEQGRYDVVLMDIQMPKLDGIQTTKRLRLKGFKFPILALTAHALNEEVNRSLDAGCNAHLTKPITRELLVRAVSQQIHRPLH